VWFTFGLFFEYKNKVIRNVWIHHNTTQLSRPHSFTHTLVCLPSLLHFATQVILWWVWYLKISKKRDNWVMVRTRIHYPYIRAFVTLSVKSPKDDQLQPRNIHTKGGSIGYRSIVSIPPPSEIFYKRGFEIWNKRWRRWGERTVENVHVSVKSRVRVDDTSPQKELSRNKRNLRVEPPTRDISRYMWLDRCRLAQKNRLWGKRTWYQPNAKGNFPFSRGISGVREGLAGFSCSCFSFILLFLFGVIPLFSRLTNLQKSFVYTFAFLLQCEIDTSGWDSEGCNSELDY